MLKKDPRLFQALFTVFILVTFFSGSPAGFAEEKPGNDRPALARYVRFCQAAREAVFRPENQFFTPSGVVMRIGCDPEKISEFVRKDIGYEPYAGVTRGAEGTLAAGSGSDWDRANLLFALLVEAGYHPRFRVFDRTPAEREKVVDEFLKANPSSRLAVMDPPLSSLSFSPPGELFQKFGVNPGNRAIRARRNIIRWKGLLDQAYDGAMEALPELEKVLRAGGIKPERTFQAWRETWMNAAKQGVAIEISRDGKKQILFPGPGSTPENIAEEGSGEELESIPEEKTGKLTVKLVLQLTRGDPATLIERTESLGDLFQQPMQLQIVPSDSGAAAVPVGQWTRENWFDFVHGFKKFQAQLKVGEKSFHSKAFDLDGKVYAVSGDGRIDNAQEMGNANQNLMGGALFGGGESPAPDKGSDKPGLEAILLEIETAIPGEKPATQKRILFGKRRPDVTPVIVTDILVAGGPVFPWVTDWMTLDAVTFNAPAYAGIVSSGDPRKFETSPAVKRLPSALYDWELGRLSLGERLLRNQSGLSLLQGPCGIMKTTHLVLDTASRAVTVRVSTDVLFDRMEIIPRSQDSVEAAFEANLALGIGSTALESGLLAKRVLNALTRGPLAQWKTEALKGSRTGILLPGKTPGEMGIQLSPLSGWAIEQHEKENVVLFPSLTGSRTWWSIDPQTGRTIGRGDGGEGQSLAEYQGCIGSAMTNLKCTLQAMAGGLQGKGDEAATGWFQCITGTDNAGGCMGKVGGVMQQTESMQGLGEIFSTAGDMLAAASDLKEAADGAN